MRFTPGRLFLTLGSASFLLWVGVAHGGRGGARLREPLLAASSWGGGLLQWMSLPAAWTRGALRRDAEFEGLRRRLADVEGRLVEREREVILLRRQLRDLAKIAERAPLLSARGLPVAVKGVDPSIWVPALWVDRGERDGLRVGMAVVAGEALVGRLSEVLDRSARVQLLADPSSAALVEVAPGPPPPGPVAPDQIPPPAPRGVLRGAGSGRDALLLDLVPNDQAVAEGAPVVTSGFDAKFPKGLYAGRVRSVRKGNVFLRIVVDPPVDYAGLEALQVLVSPWGEGAGGGQ